MIVTLNKMDSGGYNEDRYNVSLSLSLSLFLSLSLSLSLSSPLSLSLSPCLSLSARVTLSVLISRFLSGTTIAIALGKFECPKYSFTVIDALSHGDFIKNMITELLRLMLPSL